VPYSWQMRIRILAVLCGALTVAVLVPLTAATASASGGGTPSSVVSVLTSVPVSATDAVGNGGSQVSSKPQAIPGSLLTARGKPEMLYLGAQYCPYCGAESWSMIVALSRFGTFSGLKEIRSAVKNGAGDPEPFPGTPSWKFYGSRFTSKYLTFVPVEMYTNIPDPSTGSYTTLQTPTSAQLALMNKWDAPPYVPSGDNDAFPFIDVGNKFLVVGASYSPGVLSGLSWAQIAADLSRPSTDVAQAVDGTANFITAALCELTHDAPAAACTRVVKSLQAEI
jgi:hypothetical protein